MGERVAKAAIAEKPKVGPAPSGLRQQRCACGGTKTSGVGCESCRSQPPSFSRNDGRLDSGREAAAVPRGQSTSGDGNPTQSPWSNDFSRIPVSPEAVWSGLVPSALEHSQLRITDPDDPAEIEADRVADALM